MTTYEHYVYTTEAAAESLAAAYQREGLIAEVVAPQSDVLVMVYTDYDETVRETVKRVALEHGATYDGGGMYVGPLTGGAS